MSTVSRRIRPAAIAVNPITHAVYSANNADNNLTLIDGASYAPSTVSVGGEPGAIAMDPVRNAAYVANFASHSVTVIDGASDATSTVATGAGPKAIAGQSRDRHGLRGQRSWTTASR